MNITVQKNHLEGQILYRSLVPIKNILPITIRCLLVRLTTWPNLFQHFCIRHPNTNTASIILSGIKVFVISRNSGVCIILIGSNSALEVRKSLSFWPSSSETSEVVRVITVTPFLEGPNFWIKFDPLNDFFKRRASHHFKE